MDQVLVVLGTALDDLHGLLLAIETPDLDLAFATLWTILIGKEVVSEAFDQAVWHFFYVDKRAIDQVVHHHGNDLVVYLVIIY